MADARTRADPLPGEGRKMRRTLILREAARNEQRVSYFRILIVLVGQVLILYLFLSRQMKTISFWSTQAAILFVVGYSLVLLGVSRRRSQSRGIKYVAIAADVLVVTAILWSYGDVRTFKSVVNVVYFLVIGLAVYRFSWKLSLFAGFLTAVCLGGLLLLAGFRTPELYGPIQDSFSKNTISLVDGILRIVFVLAFTAVCIGISQAYERLMRASRRAELRAERERIAKGRMKDTLTRYMTAQVAELVLRKPAALSGESRVVSVLFCDIRGFTNLTSEMKPQDVVRLLNEILGRMVEVIFRHGGTLDKYLGDGLMAVFGAPLSSGRDEEMAVRAAVRIRAEIEDFNKTRDAAAQPRIAIRIGIHSGEVVAGSIGSLKRLEYTVIGSTVNLAARIEQLNKKFNTDILISWSTYEKVKALVKVEAEPLAQPRGFPYEVQTYRLLDIETLPDHKLGEELVRIGAMSEAQVRVVLERQKTDNRFFGQIAVELGFLGEDTLSMYLATSRSAVEGAR